VSTGGFDLEDGAWLWNRLDELSISKERLQKDMQGKDRYRVIGTKKAVLAEYELIPIVGMAHGLDSSPARRRSPVVGAKRSTWDACY